MTQRVYIPFMMFNARIVNMQHLWNPSTEYLGKKQEKPSWFVTCIVPKTRGNWWEEPTLAANWGAYSELLQKSGMTAQYVAEWPIKDGDMPPEPGKAPSEWAKGQWVFGGSSSNPIKAEIVQGNSVVLLPGKVGVKPGDYVALGMSAAVKQNNARALKHFCNTVLFTGAGEEIAVGNSVSGEELMRAAEQQGFRPTGFASSPGGFPGQAQQPIQQPYGQPHQPGFTQPGPAPGFPGNGQHPGFAPPNTGPGMGPGAFAGAPGHGGMPSGQPGNVTFPSNPTFPPFSPAGAFPGQR